MTDSEVVSVGRVTQRTVYYKGKPLTMPSLDGCRLCLHPNRIPIEEALCAGVTPKEAFEANIIDTHGLSLPQIQNHFNDKHMALKSAYLVYQQAAAAEKAGISLDEYRANQDREMSSLEMVLVKFNHRLLTDDEFQPAMNEGLAAIKLFNEMSRASDSAGFTPTDVFVALSQFRNHVIAILSRYLPSEVGEVVAALDDLIDSDPILGSMSIKTEAFSRASEYGTVIDVEEEIDDIEEAQLLFEFQRELSEGTVVERPPEP